MTYLIGLTARKGVGKSTLASMLVDEIEGSKIIALADALRDTVIDNVWDVFPGSHRETLVDWLGERKATIFGPLLQGYGELYRQLISANYWLDRIQEEIQLRAPAVVIVPDVRYVNEAEWIKSQDGLLVAIEGPSRWDNDQRDAQHPSETGVTECTALADETVPNLGTLGGLRLMAKGIALIASQRGGVTCRVQK